MKKILVILIIILIAFLSVFFYLNREVSLDIVETKGVELCQSVLLNIENLTIETNTAYTGYDKVNIGIENLKNTDSFCINLTNYFPDYSEDYEVGSEIENPEGSELSEEALKELYDRLASLREEFKEESTIYLNENNEKCIKVNDLRRANTGEGLVLYRDGEYVISASDIPVTYTFLKNENYFDFDLVSIEKEGKNVYQFEYANHLDDNRTRIIFTISFKRSEIVDFEMITKGFNPFK